MDQKNNRLLIVEDDLGLQGQLRWSFDGFDVEVAGDREAALAQVRRFKPGVVTLDLGLPPTRAGPARASSPSSRSSPSRP